MDNRNLYIEGDINFTPERNQWNHDFPQKTKETLARDTEVFLHQSLSTPCLNVLESCHGIYITDAEGKSYMDFHGNSVHQLGYRNEFIMSRIKSQMDILPFSPRRYTNNIAIEFAERLVSLMPPGLNRVLFAPGGTSAISMALKLARVVTGKSRVVSLQDSFHGASLDAIGAGGEEQFKKYMGEEIYQHAVNIPSFNTYRNPYPDDLYYADQLEAILEKDSTIGAFISETIRNTDVQIPSRAYWKRIREICDRHQVLLIADEIPIAFGRTGKMFAFEHYDICPDILCLGKGLGGGIFPFAAMVTKAEYNIATDVSLGHYTHEKSPLGSAAALAMLDYMEKEAILGSVWEKGLYFEKQLRKLKEKYALIGDIRGMGLLWGVELVKDPNSKEKADQEAEKIMYECLRNGLSFKVSQGNVIQLCPPLIITEEELQRAVEILDVAIQKIAG